MFTECHKVSAYLGKGRLDLILKSVCQGDRSGQAKVLFMQEEDEQSQRDINSIFFKGTASSFLLGLEC